MELLKVETLERELVSVCVLATSLGKPLQNLLIDRLPCLEGRGGGGVMEEE